MRRRPLAIAAGVLALLSGAAGTRPVRAAPDPPPGYRLRNLDDGTSRSSFPVPVDPTGPACNPQIPGVPLVLGPDFDPTGVDQIERTPSGSIVAFASTVTSAGLPGTTREIVLFREGRTKRDRVGEAAGDDDQPSVGIDRFGYRLAFRGSAAARGDSAGNVYLRSSRRKDAPSGGDDGGDDGGDGGGDTGGGETEEIETVQVTTLVDTQGAENEGTAYDPSLCPRMRTRDAGSGVKVLERDARIAFVSTGDLAKGPNEDHLPQLFVWRERAKDFVQLTRIEDAGFEVNRPSISVSGSRIAFECTADLTPAAVDPKDPTRVGNPGGVRQIYLWDARRGISQLTWSDRDCFAPRLARDGRFVLFASSGELIAGGNPERNSEIWAWVDGRDPARRLRQLTATLLGENVLPRPSRSPSVFAFWTTASPPAGAAGFGDGAPQCGPLPYLFRGGEVVRLGGLTDAENVLRLAVKPDPAAFENPVVAGPPSMGASPLKVEFVTNDPRFNEPDADDDLDGDNGGKDDDGATLPDDRDVDASILVFHVARATRFPRPR